MWPGGVPELSEGRRREESWWRLQPAHLGRPLPLAPSCHPPLPVPLADESRPGPEILQWCDGPLASAEEKLWVNSSTACSLCVTAGVARRLGQVD